MPFTARTERRDTTWTEIGHCGEIWIRGAQITPINE